MPVFDLKRTTVKIKSGSDEVEIKVGDGTLVYTERQSIEYIKDRGRLDTVRMGEEEPVDVRLDFVWELISGDATPEEAIKRTGAAEEWISSDDDECNPYAVDIEVTYDRELPESWGGDCTGAPTILLPDYRWETLEHDLKAGTISTTGKCNVPTIDPTVGT
jgi:hypothetical protein